MGGGSFVVGIHLLKEGYYTGGRVSWGDYIERVGGEVEAAGGQKPGWYVTGWFGRDGEQWGVLTEGLTRVFYLLKLWAGYCIGLEGFWVCFGFMGFGFKVV